jgi:preprotein translocase subunit YajC
MRTGLARCLAAAVVLAGMGAAVAQEGPGRGEMALGNGRMIRGTVTATAADHLTIKTDAGDVFEIAITPNTRMTKDRQPVKPADVKIGDGVGAMGELDAPKKTVHALFVAVVDAEQVKKMREDLGKSYITGKVTAIDDVKLTVLRPDNVSQVIEVDETTSFRKGGRRGFGALVMEGGAPVPVAPSGGAAAGASGGESITLADIKVGDVVAGQGGMKHGVFVPTNLTVLPPGTGQRGRRGGEAAVTTAPGETPTAGAPKQ